MKLLRILLAATVVAGLSVLAFVSQKADTPADRMVDAAEKFLSTLDDKQKAKATFDFDDKERTNWNFVPLQTMDKKSTRKGLPLEDMNAEQRKAALNLLRAGVSEAGYEAATTIMSLEAILRDLEKAGAMVRNPDWYFVTIFGKPSKTAAWGWRLEGHHLSLNFTLDKGAVVSATPAFFGANPATVRAGEKKGLQTLAGAEKLALELFDSLSDEQKTKARQKERYPEIEQKVIYPGVGKPRGLAVADMTADQRGILTKLIEDYAGRMPREVAAVQRERLEKAGIDKIHFGISREDDKPGKPWTYRVQGPTFVIEFLNVQEDAAKNPANHIHSSWRDLDGDFGMRR